MGVSTAAAPLAAKAALDEGIAKQAGIKLFSGAGGLPIPSGVPESVGLKPGTPWVSYEDRVSKSATFIKAFGLPDFVESDLRERAKWIGGFDPDIACKRSWSIAVKIQEQRQRNYERQLANFQSASFRLKAKSALEKILGFEWPW